MDPKAIDDFKIALGTDLRLMNPNVYESLKNGTLSAYMNKSNPQKVGSEMFAGLFAVGAGGGPDFTEDVQLLLNFQETLKFMKKNYPTGLAK